MAFVFGGVTFTEHAESMGVSPTASYGWNDSTVTRVYDVPWINWPAAVTALLGYPEHSALYVIRHVPHTYPLTNITDFRRFLYATKVTSVVGLTPTGNTTANAYQGDGGQTVGTFNTARLTVQYTTLPFDILSDAEMAAGASYSGTTGTGFQLNGHAIEYGWKRYITKLVRPTGQFITLPQTVNGSISYKWVDTTSTLEQGVSKLINPAYLQVTWHQVPEQSVPSKLINDGSGGYIEVYLGKVNSLIFNNMPIGTLLYTAAELKPYRDPNGQRIFDITYTFKYFRPSTKGHQALFKPTSAAWIEVTTDGATNLVTQTAGKSIYDWADFRDLFQPG